MKVSKIALGVAIALGGASVIAVSPAFSQRAPTRSNDQPEDEGDSRKRQGEVQITSSTGAKLNLSKEERAALGPLVTAVQASNWAAASAALPAAQAAARGSDARLAVASQQLKIGAATNNVALQTAAIDAMIASGGAPADTLPTLYKNQGALAEQAGDRVKAEAAYAKWVELAGNDPNSLVALAKAKADLKKHGESARLLARAVAARKASGQPVPESWLKVGANYAMVSKMAPETIQLSRELIVAYPTPVNWRDALLNYRQLGSLDRATNLDLLRLMRVTKSLSGERDYYELADTLSSAGLPGESKAVLDEGIASRMVDRTKVKDLLALSSGKVAEDKGSLASVETKAKAAATGEMALKTADAHYGYGNYAKAAELYRVAIQKGGVDAAVANTRLGMALAQAGQKAEAEAAFKAVTGPRADLASYWLIWLNQRG